MVQEVGPHIREQMNSTTFFGTAAALNGDIDQEPGMMQQNVFV